MSSPFVSIIIPMYNAELYIKKTICSVINQTYKDFELLIIDDGSTDSSLIICKDLALKDKRIIVLSKSNGGVSSARNYGLEHAKGEWILFLDSDDYITKEYLQSFILQLNKEHLLVQKGCNIIHPNGKHEIYCINDIYFTSNTNKHKFCNLYNKNLLYSSVWGKIFSRDIIANNQLKFNEKIRNGEDRLFVSDYLLCPEVTAISFVNDIGYYYLLREGSITHSDVNINSYCLSNTYHLRQLRNLTKKYKTDDVFNYNSFSIIKKELYDVLFLYIKKNINNNEIYEEIKCSLKSLSKYKTNKKLDLLFKILPFDICVFILKKIS